ncbi:hypothetical protein ACVWW4_002763 [Bradyrhizobium sp. LB7.1]
MGISRAEPYLAAAEHWLAEREADLLPVLYFHVVFTLPAAIADIAYQNKAVIYDLLFKASAETLTTIAADPKHLGARIGITSVLHSWGSAMTHHPHVHMIVPGGGISLDGGRWVACRSGFFLPVRVLSRLFRRLFLEKLVAAHDPGRLQFFGNHAALTDAQAFAAYLTPLRDAEWVVYSKRPFASPATRRREVRGSSSSAPPRHEPRCHGFSLGCADVSGRPPRWRRVCRPIMKGPPMQMTSSRLRVPHHR